VKRHLMFALGSLLGACTQQQQPAQLRALEASGAVAFVCLGRDFEPGPRRDCADPESGRRLFALVTQTTRGEVALVDSARGIVDIDPTQPSYGFLPVGAQPVDIVSTPGGLASFVGVAEVGREGVFALPTSCVRPPREDEPPRDLTTWPACRLPTAPGSMAIVFDREDAGVGSCAPPFADGGGLEAGGSPPGNVACPADLSAEQGPPGRRKLVVSLPEWGELAVIDAQWLLDREPGTYEPCVLEERLALEVALPDGPVSQRPPPDLVGAGPIPGLQHGPPQDSFASRPAGFALSDDGAKLYIADIEAPVVHIVDTSRPCRLRELPPLLPMSFADPGRVVRTNRIAVSPLTSDARRFLYAIDEVDNGSVMIFDVSDDSTDRTPLLRPRSARFPLEAPDRIAFLAPAKDVAFGFREWALASPPLGSAIDAIACDPDPRTPAGDPGAQRRPSGNFASGARHDELRGVFAFLALSSGQVAVIDVDDRDAACRRPIQANPSEVEDFRGCAGDPEGIAYFTVNQDPEATPTVTGELSCQVVQPHRARSASPLINTLNFGVRAPALRAYPFLTSDLGRRLPTDQTEEGRQFPRMLGVDFSEQEPGSVYVGSTLHRRGAGREPLVIDPAEAEQNSLVLNLAEPRAYPVSETFTAVYEGVVLGERPVARLTRRSDGLELADSGIVFCDRGVQSRALMSVVARDLGVERGSDIDAFGHRHADFVFITSDILPEDHSYWTHNVCGAADPEQPGASFAQCRARFGPRDAPTNWRELRVLEANRSRLVVEPRHVVAQRAAASDLIACCFPELISYEVRASHQWIVRGSVSGFRHRIRTAVDDPSTPDVDETGQCVFDGSPLRAGLNSRAFEVSCRDDPPGSCPRHEDGAPAIGLARPGEDTGCVVEDPLTEVKVLGPGNPCIFSNHTMSFVIYRGLEPSRRDMTFSWEVIGGFVPFSFDLTRDGLNTVPESIVYSPEAQLLAVTDGSTRGFSLIYLHPLLGEIRTFF
jgi:hypothetical protein